MPLGLSQPTGSQPAQARSQPAPQEARTGAGRILVNRDTRVRSLTDNGEAMLGFARTILVAHHQLVAVIAYRSPSITHALDSLEGNRSKR